MSDAERVQPYIRADVHLIDGNEQVLFQCCGNAYNVASTHQPASRTCILTIRLMR
jgi:hypothetical protein